MFRYAPIVLACMLPTSLLADTRLDRLENISEKMNDAMFDAMIRMVEREGGNPEPLRAAVPDGAWNDEYRTAGACVLDKYIDASSKAAVDKMLDDMEAFVPKMEDIDLDQIGEEADFLPEGISDEFSISVNTECGLTDLMLDRMEESGFTAAMMQSMAEN